METFEIFVEDQALENEAPSEGIEHELSDEQLMRVGGQGPLHGGLDRPT